MTSRNLGNVVDYLRRIVSPFSATASDHHLLAHFLSSRDEAAFAALLKRHGPMVFGVSRRVLSRVQDAEDVVQATFLLLAQGSHYSPPRIRGLLAAWRCPAFIHSTQEARDGPAQTRNTRVRHARERRESARW